jgi:hypothetical protein
MHPDTEEPRALQAADRNRPPGSDWLAQSLRDLPELDPPERAWARLSNEMDRRRSARRRRWMAAAAAALLATAVISYGVSRRIQNHRPVVVESSVDAPLDELVAASQALESVLQSPPLQSPVMSPAQAARIVTIEDHIALIDSQLESVVDLTYDRQLALWSGRVGLLDELVRVRGASRTAGQVRFAHQR